MSALITRDTNISFTSQTFNEEYRRLVWDHILVLFIFIFAIQVGDCSAYIHKNTDWFNLVEREAAEFHI